MAMMGAWLGWPALTFIFMGASVQALAGVILARVFGWDFERDANELFEEDRRAAEADRAGAQTEARDADPRSEPSADADAPDANAPEVGADATERDAAIALPVDPDADVEVPLPAVPFGPFIVLAGLEYYFLGPSLPEALSMAQFYLP